MGVALSPTLARSLRVLGTSGKWVYPQPSNMRASQETLIALGLAEVVDGIGQEEGRRFLRITDRGRTLVGERMTICKNCGQAIHLHWTGGWVHDKRTPSGNYLYCGFRAEPEGGGRK